MSDVIEPAGRVSRRSADVASAVHHASPFHRAGHPPQSGSPSIEPLTIRR